MKRRIMSIDKAHCQQDWRVSTRWLHSLFWVYFQTTVSEWPSSVEGRWIQSTLAYKFDVVL